MFCSANVGKDPEIRNIPSGIVAEISLATNERYPDGRGGWQDRTEWHTVVAFGRNAEIVREYVRIGGKIFIEGKLRTDSWDDHNAGVRRYWTKIVIFNLVLLSRSESRFSEEEYQEDSGEDFASPYAHIPEEAITAQDIPF